MVNIYIYIYMYSWVYIIDHIVEYIYIKLCPKNRESN